MLSAQTSDLMLAAEGIKLLRIGCRLQTPITGAFLGVDPGQVHMGVAAIFGDVVYLYEIELESSEQSVEAMMRVTSCMQIILAGLPKPTAAVIEGAAHMAAWGQVPLETARTSAAIAVLTHGVWPVEVIPPKKIRQTIFGNGNIRQQEVWPDFPENAASALGCALYAKEKLSV